METRNFYVLTKIKPGIFMFHQLFSFLNRKMKKIKDRKSEVKGEMSPKSMISLSQVPSSSYFSETMDLPPVVHFHLATSIHAENGINWKILVKFR